MNAITLDKPLNLTCSLESGQFFQWQRYDSGYVLQSGLRIFYLEQQENTLRYKPISGDIDEAFLRSFFRMDEDLSAIFHPWRNDPLLMETFRRFEGLRVFRQDPWECLVSFLCSAASNIPRITANVRTLSDRFGGSHVHNGQRWSALPTPDQLADVRLHELYEAGIGFRAKYLRKIVDRVLNGFHLKALRSLPYHTAKRELMTLPGIGDKIADCVLLFSLGKSEAFPTDTWMRKVLLTHYFPNESATSRLLPRLARERFGEYAGYAQQYLYHWARQY